MNLSTILSDQFHEVVVREDGMINGTKMCEDHGKMLSNWLRLDSTGNLITYLESTVVQICATEKTGGVFVPGKGTSKQTVWLHRHAAYDLASWISVEFKVAVYTLLDEYLQGNIQPVSETPYVTRAEFAEFSNRVIESIRSAVATPAAPAPLIALPDPREVEAQHLLDMITVRWGAEGGSFKLPVRSMIATAREHGLFEEMLGRISDGRPKDFINPRICSLFGKMFRKLTREPFTAGGGNWQVFKRYCNGGRACYEFYPATA